MPGLTPNTPTADYADDPRAAAIAEAARRLVELRDRWLNPPEWVEWVDEPVPGYPQRPVPRDEAAATALKTRTLTSLVGVCRGAAVVSGSPMQGEAPVGDLSGPHAVVSCPAKR